MGTTPTANHPPLPPTIPLEGVLAAYTADDNMTLYKWVKWAYACASRVLPIFETRYPQDKRPAEALAITKRWLDESGSVADKKLRFALTNASNAAYDAADVAAGAAADAAYAAVNAAYAAYDAAYAADAAAYAARAAAHATIDKSAEETWQAIHLMEIYHDA